jgi:hypothetical protein
LRRRKRFLDSTHGGYLAEIDRMNPEFREYLLLHPSEVSNEAA